MDNGIIIALISATIGGVITYFASLLLDIQRSKHIIREKIIDKKLAALDELLLVAKVMIITVNTNDINANNAPVTYPKILHNYDDYMTFHVYYIRIFSLYSHWISNKLNKELLLFHDYLMNIDKLFNDHPILKTHTERVGCILKDDFKDFAYKIEKLILDSYRASYLRRRALPDYRKDDTRYSKEKVVECLKKTNLYTKHKEIIDLIYE